MSYRYSTNESNIVEGFTCANCGGIIPIEAAGTHNRNHCPSCLHSLHVDIRPGDRANPCRGVMQPITLWRRPGGEIALIHRCTRCGELIANRIAGDDSEAQLEKLRQQLKVYREGK